MGRRDSQPNLDEVHDPKCEHWLSWSAMALLAAAMVLGVWQPELLRDVIDQIVTL